MPFRVFVLVIILAVPAAAAAQVVYEISFWQYRQIYGGYDTVSARARKSNYSLHTYNNNEQLLSVDEYSAPNRPGSRTRYILDDTGRVAQELQYFSADTELPHRRTLYHYDPQGRILNKSWGERRKSDDSVMVVETYAYDTLDRVLSINKSEYYVNVQTARGHISVATKSGRPPGFYRYSGWTSSYKDLPQGYEKRTLWKDAYHKKTITTVSTYNEHGDLVREQTGHKILINTYQYGDDGKWIVMKSCYRDGALMPFVCKGEWRRRKLE